MRRPVLEHCRLQQLIEGTDTARLDDDVHAASLTECGTNAGFVRLHAHIAIAAIMVAPTLSRTDRVDDHSRPPWIGNVAVCLTIVGVGFVERDAETA